MYVSKKWIGKRAYPIFLYVGVPSSLHLTLYSLIFPLKRLSVLAWHATVILLEAFVEIALIQETDLETNFCDRVFSFKDKFCGNTHFFVHNKIENLYIYTKGSREEAFRMDGTGFEPVTSAV